MLAVVLLHIAGDGGLLESVGDIAFVIKIMSFVYILFWLYQTFAESQVLFGLSALGAGYLILFSSTVFVALAVVVLLMVMGMWLQQSLQFGLFPLLGVGQGGMMGGGGEEMGRIQQKLQLGQQLTAEEAQMAQSMQAQQEQAYYQQQMQAGMRRR